MGCHGNTLINIHQNLLRGDDDSVDGVEKLFRQSECVKPKLLCVREHECAVSY